LPTRPKKDKKTAWPSWFGRVGFGRVDYTPKERGAIIALTSQDMYPLKKSLKTIWYWRSLVMLRYTIFETFTL
jgi:hypothetical protein